jgi:hypothetical protein
MRARITTSGCARMWRSVEERPPRIGEARMACLGCEIGAINAGVDVEAARRAVRASVIAPICARCGTAGSRLIGGETCISCYNRLREVKRGKDGRGRPPQFAAKFHSVALAVTVGGRITHRVYPMVTSWAEAIVLAAKRADGAGIAAGPPRLSALPIGAQLEIDPIFAPLNRRPRGPRRATAAPPPHIIIVPSFFSALQHAQ